MLSGLRFTARWSTCTASSNFCMSASVEPRLESASGSSGFCLSTSRHCASDSASSPAYWYDSAALNPRSLLVGLRAFDAIDQLEQSLRLKENVLRETDWAMRP